MGNTVRLFLDSGSFGAWSRGKDIDVRDYIGYIKANEEFIWQYVNLDVIPGKFGRRDNTEGEIDKSAAASHKNQRLMRKAGLHPIPVFHMGEKINWLERYLDEGEDYIGLSCNKFVRIDEQRKWLDMCFNFLTDKEGHPLVRTHGFALTAFPLLTNYPWFTVDSTTWSLTPGYGQIIIPAMIKGKFDYHHEPVRIAISGVTHKSTSSQSKQYEQFTIPKGRSAFGEVVDKYLQEECGIDATQTRYGTNDRRRAMLVYYLNLCKVLRAVRFTGSRGRIFGPDHLDSLLRQNKMKALKPFNLQLTLATSLNREWSELMTKVGANCRLLSYWEMQTRDNSVLREYVKTGTNGVYKQARMRPDWSETYLNRRRLAMLKRVKSNDVQGENREAETGREGKEKPRRISQRVRVRTG